MNNLLSKAEYLFAKNGKVTISFVNLDYSEIPVSMTETKLDIIHYLVWYYSDFPKFSIS